MTLDIAWIELQRATAPARALGGDHRRTAAEKGDRGISVMSGSDTGNASAFCRGRWRGKEAELFVKEVGMPPMEAIVANTSRNAWLMGLEGEVGVIASGKLADIVIWNSSPIAPQIEISSPLTFRRGLNKPRSDIRPRPRR